MVEQKDVPGIDLQVNKIMENGVLREVEAVADSFGAGRHKKMRGTKALSKALDTLFAVADSEEPQRFGELINKTGLPRTTLFRILKTFTEYGILSVDPDQRTYGLGFKLFEVARKIGNSNDLIVEVIPELAGLAEEIGETARIWVMAGSDMVLFDHCHPSDPVPLVHTVGSRVRLSDSAAGLAVLAYLPHDEQKRRIDEAVLTGPPEAAKALANTLRSRLGFAISTGFSVIESKIEPGVREIAAALVNSKGEPVAAVSIACSARRVSEVQLHEIGRRIAHIYRAARKCVAVQRSHHRKIPIRPRHADQSEVIQVAEAKDHVGASPVWDPRLRSLYWTDILGSALNSLHLPTGQRTRTALRDLTGALGLTTGRLLIAGSQSGFQFLDPRSGKATNLIDPEMHIPGSRLGHGRVGPDGRFWVASMLPTPGLGPGRLYSIGPDCSVRTEIKKINAAKGLAWSPNGHVFFLTEASTGSIYHYEVDHDTGQLRNRRRLIQHEGPGTPNGIAVDSQGCLWVAIYGGWALHRYAPSGALMEKIPLPVPLPTSLVFGGKNDQTLFITSSRIHVPPPRLVEAPQSGGLFSLNTQCRGVPIHRFEPMRL